MTTNHKTLLSRYISRTWEHLWSYRWHSSEDYIRGPYCSRSWMLYVCVPKRGFCESANVSYGYHVFWKLVFPKLLSYVLRTNILASWQSNKGLGSKSFMICKCTSLSFQLHNLYLQTHDFMSFSTMKSDIFYTNIIIPQNHFSSSFFLLLQIPRLFWTLELRNNENKLLSIR